MTNHPSSENNDSSKHGHHGPSGHHDHHIRSRRGNFIIAGLTSGHGVFHWFLQSFLVLLPEIEAAFGLSKVGVGLISTIRETVSGIITLPGGVLADIFRRHWGLLLALCMGFFGVGWLIVGQASVFPVLLIGVSVVATAASMWHLPALASLSHHYSHRRGTALSFHGIGGNIGDAVSPVVTGFLLGYLAWKDILSIYAVVPMALAFLVFWAFRDIGKNLGGENTKNDTGQIAQTRAILRNPLIWMITIIGGIRGMAYVALVTFLPSYLSNDLELSNLMRGVYFGLLVAVGIFFTPIMGYLSDRFGRREILIPGMIFLSVVVMLMAIFQDRNVLLLLICLLGTFFYSDQPILTAAALDIVGEGVATTTLGSLSFARFVLSALSPLVAGFLYENYSMDHVFYYVAALMIFAALLLSFTPLKSPSSHGGH